MADKGGLGKTISLQDWEQIIQDFRTSTDLQQKWLSIWPGLALVEQALFIVAKKEFAVKAQLLVFIEENADVLIGSEVSTGFGMILDSLRAILQSPSDGIVITIAIRENMMVMATTVAIVTDVLHNAREKLEGLVELFLVFINRPNHTSDRHVRGLACESLRELEMAYPCLLYGCLGHIHFLSLNEKTHANQSYILLLTTIVENLSSRMYTSRSKSANYLPILQNTAPLVPFSVPFFLVSSCPGEEAQALPARELTPGNLREFRTVVAFLLERPQLLTTVGMLELVSSVIKISKALDLAGPTLKTHFSSLLHSYSPVLCHIVLLIYVHFSESMDGDEGALLKRLIALSRDDSQSLAFCLLGVHWVLGVETLHLQKQKLSILAPFASGLYPLVFEPLSLKAAKLGALAHCAVVLDQQGSVSQGDVNSNGNHSGSLLLSEGLSSVSYNWLPSWSTETQLAFHIFHKFLTVGIPHTRTRTHIPDQVGLEGPLFQTLQNILVTLAVQMRKLVPNLVVLLDRLLGCDIHRPLGETLLRTFNDELLPQLQPNHQLPSYFPLMERISGNSEIPPTALIDKLTIYMRHRVREDDGDEECALWSRSSQVLGICRTVILHHQSSRVFHVLAPLLGFLCRFFPDIEIRDTARLYLRMLISIPGSKLRYILKYGDERIEEANAPHISEVSSLLRCPSPPTYQGHKQSPPVSSYIQLTRVTPLLIRHSWSMVLFEAFQSSGWLPDDSNTRCTSELGGENVNTEKTNGTETALDKQVDHSKGGPWLHSPSQRPFRVLDTRTSEVITILRRHFAGVPDYFNGAGFKIRVPCTLRFQGEKCQWFLGEPGDSQTWRSRFGDLSDSWPAIYSAVITLTTSGPYGPIRKIRVPFLLSEPPQKRWQRTADSPAANVSETVEVEDSEGKGQGNYYQEDLSQSEINVPKDVKKDGGFADISGEEREMFHELVIAEVEPKQPVPTLLDAFIVFSDDEGRAVQGQLDNIPVGIEDLFTKPPLPPDLVEGSQTDYLVTLFHALWEACSGPGQLGLETFSLEGALVTVSIQGSESVKLLEAQADRVVSSVEHFLAQFVVAIKGGPLVTITRDAGVFQHVNGFDEEVTSSVNSSGSGKGGEYQAGSPFQKNTNDESALQLQVRDSRFDSAEEVSRSGLGSFLLLIFLPPRYHLLLRMEVADESTLVRIRTDHWPCLAHVDEYLEALVTVG